jgi:hypothetical protein
VNLALMVVIGQCHEMKLSHLRPSAPGTGGRDFA